ncbi:MAG: transposase [Deltaproteobacteria bacterium]|nr:transposase [Deltaproteobacteria bacterium]
MPEYKKGHIFFLTCSTFKKYPWFELYPELASTATELLKTLSENRGAELFAWCIMPDHCHLVLRDNDVIEFMRLFKGALTPKARQFENGRSLWQRSFHDHALRNTESVLEAAGYAFENPVKAGLVDSPESYPLSGSLVWQDWQSAYTKHSIGRG